MIDQNDIKKIKNSAEEFFQLMTLPPKRIEVEHEKGESPEGDIVVISATFEEPQILIGEKGQTLSEIQRLMRTILNKKIQKIFHLSLDINEYKKKKVEYLKDLAKDLADEVSLTREERVLSPMSAYERRVIHSELAGRTDISTESSGMGAYRHIVIRPK